MKTSDLFYLLFAYLPLLARKARDVLVADPHRAAADVGAVGDVARRLLRVLRDDRVVEERDNEDDLEPREVGEGCDTRRGIIKKKWEVNRERTWCKTWYKCYKKDLIYSNVRSGMCKAARNDALASSKVGNNIERV